MHEYLLDPSPSWQRLIVYLVIDRAMKRTQLRYQVSSRHADKGIDLLLGNVIPTKR